MLRGSAPLSRAHRRKTNRMVCYARTCSCYSIVLADSFPPDHAVGRKYFAPVYKQLPEGRKPFTGLHFIYFMAWVGRVFV